MAALAFDTYKAVKALQAAGAAEPLAEAVVATVGAAVGDNVATKADLAEVKAELKAALAGVKAELKTDLAEVKAELKEDAAKGIQEVYKFLVMSTLTIAGTIIATAIAVVRYLAPQ